MCFCRLREGNMSSKRLKVVLLHTWYHFTHSLETWVDIFWNPAIQIWVYTLIALSFVKGGDSRGFNVIIGMIFWQIIWVGQYSITIGPLWEIWAKSFSSLFISPLSMGEFVLGQMISGVVKSVFAFAMACTIAYLLYDFSIFSLGWVLPVYYVEFLLFSWAAGIMLLSLIFRYSTQVQSLSWALIFLVQPFGAVFYPVTVLPEYVRWIAYIFPVTYVFETIRLQLQTSFIDWRALGIATIINGIWLIAAWSMFVSVYATAKRSGAFARLEG